MFYHVKLEERPELLIGTGGGPTLSLSDNTEFGNCYW